MKKVISIFFIPFLLACSVMKNGVSSKHISDSENINSRKMLDGKYWTVENVNISIPDSYCQEGDPALSYRYGRLYTWKAAKNACSQLGLGWRLPTLEEWQILARHYGGIHGDSQDNGNLAYRALLRGGNSGFNAVLGGNRESNGNYERLEAHGFYWTSTEADNSQAWFINFAKGASLMNQHTGEKGRAISLRCIRN